MGVARSDRRAPGACLLDKALALVARQKALNFPPGSRYSYTNSGYVLAAIIIGRVSGKSLGEFTHERHWA